MIAMVADDPIAEVVSLIGQMTLAEVVELNQRMKDEFDIEPMAPQIILSPALEAVEVEEVEEKTEFTVRLVAIGEMKINVIKVVRGLMPSLGLKEAKDKVESAPADILVGVDKTTAESAVSKLEGVGATVNLL